MMPLETALATMPPTLNATRPISCLGIASSMIHLANSGGKRPMIEPTTMQRSVSASCFQYGKKKEPSRFQSTLRSIFGRSGLNIWDHIMWLGPPPPSIVQYNPYRLITVRVLASERFPTAARRNGARNDDARGDAGFGWRSRSHHPLHRVQAG